MSETSDGAAPERVQLTRIKGKNFKCISDLEIDLGDGEIHTIKGDAGQGKTAVIQMAEAGFCGLDKSMIRNGCDSAEVELELSIGVLNRIFKRDASQDVVMLKGNDGKEIPKAKEFLRTIASPSVFNVLQWVQLSGGPEKGKTERLRMQRDQLLAGISARLNEEDVVDAVMGLGKDHAKALKDAGIEDINFDQHGFVVTSKLMDACVQMRLRHNAAKEAAEATLSITPAPDRAAPESTAEELRAVYDGALRDYHHAEAQQTGKRELQKRKEALEAEIAQAAEGLPKRAEVDKTRTSWEQRQTTAKADVERLEKELKEARERLENADASLRRCAQLESKLNAQEARQRDRAELEAELSGGEGKGPDLESLRAKHERAKRDLDTRTQQDTHDAAAKAAEVARGRWQLYQDLVELFRDEIPRLLIKRANLPIEGLSVDENQILIHGVPLHQLGTSEQIRTGVMAAIANNPRCGFIGVDGLESVGRSDRIALAKAARDNHLRMIMTEVDPEAEPEPGVTVMRAGAVVVAA